MSSTAEAQRRSESRISWRTLLVASMASVAAAFVVSALWAPGTLIGAAVTPVIVALTSELLRKPIEAVPSPSAALAPLRPSGHGGPPPAAQEHPHADDPVVPTAPRPDGLPPHAEPARRPVVHQYARSDYRTWDRKRIKLALVTGALAFAIAVAFFVVADLTTGSAVTGRGGSSSLFSPRKDRNSTPATTTTTEQRRPTTQQQTTTPQQTQESQQDQTRTQAAPQSETTTQPQPQPTPTTETPAPLNEAAPEQQSTTP